MPQPFLHILFAAGVLERWRTAPASAPLDVHKPDVGNAFLHGALGPDMGFFPGADATISRLTHGVFTGQLARELHEAAASEAERAFALGWVTHILADAQIHPLVNGAAAWHARSGADRVEADDGAGRPDGVSLLAHVRVEIGIDLWYFDRAGATRMRRLRHALGARGIAFLTDALQRTYRLPFSPRQLHAMHRNVTRLYNAYLLLARLLAPDVALRRAGERAGPRHRLARGIQRLVRAAAATPVPVGFVHPLPPARALIERVDAALVRCDALLDGYVETGLRDLPDLDLETGVVLPTVSVEPRDDRLRVARRRAVAAQVRRDGVAVA